MGLMQRLRWFADAVAAERRYVSQTRTMSPGEKFRYLEEQALRLARQPFTTGNLRVSAMPTLTIWRYPAFAPYESWSLASLPSSPDWTLRRFTWHRGVDYRRATEPLKQAAFMIESRPAPTLDIADVRVSRDYAEDAVAVVQALQIPSESGPHFGIDGTINGVFLAAIPLEREWWCEGPSQWQSFTNAIERLRCEFASAFPS
jgi:hypothetical protein